MLKNRHLGFLVALAFMIMPLAAAADTNATEETQWPDDAPKEIVACVADFLDGSDFAHATQVCATWKRAIDENLFLFVPSDRVEFLRFVSENTKARIAQTVSRRHPDNFAKLIYQHFGHEIAHAQSPEDLFILWSQACDLLNIAFSLYPELDRRALIDFTSIAAAAMRQMLFSSNDHHRFFVLAANGINHRFQPDAHPVLPMNNWLLYCELLQTAHSTGDMWAEPRLAVACKMQSFDHIQNEYARQDGLEMTPALTLYGEQLAYFNENREALEQFYDDDLLHRERSAFWKRFNDLPEIEKKLGFLRF